MALGCAPSNWFTCLVSTPPRRTFASAALLSNTQYENAAPNTGVSLTNEINRRRNLAILSDPGAGLTTLSEKLLLYGGAMQEVDSLKKRREFRYRNMHAKFPTMEDFQRAILIPWMIPMVFETKGYRITLLDTPGHQDYGDDSFRTLAAVDNAVMLVDAGKGLEPTTRKLFEVCRMRKLPVFTFFNKLDTPALQPFQLADQIEKEFGLSKCPVSWPIGSGDRFVGVYYRPRREVHLFQQGGQVRVVASQDPILESVIAADLHKQLQEEIKMLEELTPEVDVAKIRSGDLSPVYFGSALHNLGVELFLESFLEFSSPPRPHQSNMGVIPPENPDFSAFVFKAQANNIAFLRVCSGQFTQGMEVQTSRTGRPITLSSPQDSTAFAGDVIGVNNPNHTLCIGDTVHTGPRVSYPGIPLFSPELFFHMRTVDPSKGKQFDKGINELLMEGAIQVFWLVGAKRKDPVFAAVRQVQFEATHYRIANEYGVETKLEPLRWHVARWVTGGWPALENAGKLENCAVAKDLCGRPVLLFQDEGKVAQLMGEKPDIGELLPYAMPPEDKGNK